MVSVTNAMEKPCRNCQQAIDEDLLKEQIAVYIKNIPEQLKTDSDTYSRRTVACEGCEMQSVGICRLCGCFISIRAAKKRLSCPYPGRDKWL